MNYILYGNGGSGNHGCEAIIRGTFIVLGSNMRVVSQSPEEDIKYGIDRFAEIKPAIINKPGQVEWLKAYLKLKISGNFIDMDGIAYLPAIRELSGKSKVALSAGGDNYCYDNPEFYAYLNSAYINAGFNTILWGCSVDPAVVMREKITEDLRRYRLIVARESISYDALQKINQNTILAVDPAFFMEPVQTELPSVFENGKVIGLNASPMIISNEKTPGITYRNYLNLIKCILKETNYNIALIPHVVWTHNDDRTVLNQLYKDADCP